MPVRSRYSVGAPCWIDRISAGLARAEAFYGDVFGWEFVDDGGYRLACKDGQIVAGFGTAPGAQDTWTVYLATKDIDAAAAAVTQHGGRIVLPPMTVGANGALAVGIDPTGATVGFWSGARAEGVVLADECGAACGYALHTTDPGAAADFYGAVLGIDTADAAGAAGLVVDGDRVADLFAATSGRSHWLVHFGVDDLLATVSTALRHGARPVGEPTDGAIVLVDPLGASFGVRQLAASASTA